MSKTRWNALTLACIATVATLGAVADASFAESADAHRTHPSESIPFGPGTPAPPDPDNRCELSRVYLSHGETLSPAAASAERACDLVTDRSPATAITIPGADHALEIRFIGAPRWVNRVSVDTDGDVSIDAWMLDGSWKPLGTVAAGEVLETSDLRVRGLRVSPPDPAQGDLAISDVDARWVQFDPDHGSDTARSGGYLYHYDWVNDYPWTSNLSKCDNDARGLRDKLPGWGWGGHGNSSAHEHHFVRDDIGSGQNTNHIDWADLSYFSGHGSGSIYDGGYEANYGAMRFGVSVDGTAMNPSEGYHAWGNSNMEWLMATSCQTLNDVSRGVWYHTMAGMHLFCGTVTNIYDKDYGSAIGRKLVDSGAFDSADKVRIAWFDALDYRNYSGMAQIVGETSSCGNDYIWGQGSVVADPTHDGYYAYWHRDLSGLREPGESILETHMISNPERYRPPSDPVVFARTGENGIRVSIDRSVMSQRRGTFVTSYLVVSTAAEPVYVRGIADAICARTGALCGGDIGPGHEGEMCLVVGPDELTVYDGSGGWEFKDVESWLAWHTTPPAIPMGTAAQALADGVVRDVLGAMPDDAVFDRVDYIGQGGMFAPEDGPERIDPDSTFTIGSRALYQRRIADGPNSYPVVGGAKMSVTFGNGGDVDRFFVNGWRKMVPGESVPVIDFSEVVDGLTENGWAATVDPIRTPADEIQITDVEIGYYEPGADIDVDEIKPVYVIRANLLVDGESTGTPAEFYAWVEYPGLTGEILSPADSSVVEPGSIVCFDARGNGGAPPYTYEWVDETGAVVGVGESICIPVDLPPLGHEEQEYVRTFEVRVRDSDGNEANDEVRVYLADALATESVSSPVAFTLGQNRPNPFNPRTTISFEIPTSAGDAVDVHLAIYDARGRRVRTLVDGARVPNRYTVTWDGMDDSGLAVSSGIYFSRLEAPGFQATRQMTLIR